MVRVDFLVDIEEEHIAQNKPIRITSLNGGVIVSSRVIREFRGLYKNDLNRLIRDATKHQQVTEIEMPDEERLYTPVKEASDAEEALNQMSANFRVAD